MRITMIVGVVCLLIYGCNTTARTNRQTLKKIPTTLLGRFKDDYSSSYKITPNEWTQGKNIKYHLLLYNPTDNYIIAKNDEANPSDAGLFTRIDIMYFENMDSWQWGFCLTAFKAKSVEEAINTVSADRSNPRKGCNGYPFSRMKPQ